jgi:hypothetical protein
MVDIGNDLFVLVSANRNCKVVFLLGQESECGAVFYHFY